MMFNVKFQKKGKLHYSKLVDAKVTTPKRLSFFQKRTTTDAHSL